MLESTDFQKKWLTLQEEDIIYGATFHFMDEIESPQVNNIEDRMLYANSIAEWYEREVLKEE